MILSSKFKSQYAIQFFSSSSSTTFTLDNTFVARRWYKKAQVQDTNLGNCNTELVLIILSIAT
jgi:hypothetical protein